MSGITMKAFSLPRRIRMMRTGRIGFYLSAGYIIALILLSVVAQWLPLPSPTQQNLSAILEPASLVYPIGTDDLGRDVLSRLVFGAPITLMASLLAVSVGCLIGLPLGLLAGFSGGWVDTVISRAIDTMLSFPAIILAISVTGALGVGLINSMVAIGIVFSPTIARLVRGQTLIGRDALYVDAARCFGASNTRLILRHVLPNAVQPVLVQVTLLLATALLAEASLSFLGLGVQPPDADWGSLVRENIGALPTGSAAIVAPALAIASLTIAVNLLIDNLPGRAARGDH